MSFAITEKSIALREIRENDYRLYGKICRVLAEPDIEMTDAIPLEYAHDLADDTSSPEDVVFGIERKTTTSQILLELKPREERVIRMRFGMSVKEHTLEEIGQTYYVTKDRIRQIEAKALRKLKCSSRSRELLPLIEGIAA